MRLLLLSCFIWLFAASSWAACPSRTYTYTTGQTIDPSQVTTNEDSLFTYSCAVDTYAAGSVNAAAIADDAVGASEIAAGAVGTSEIATDGVEAAEIAANAVGTSEIATDGVAAAEIATDAVDVVDMVNTGTKADDKVLVADSSTAGTWRTLTNCTDTGGNHLNYTQSTNSFSCGTSTSTTATVGDRVHRTSGDVTTTSTSLVDLTGASITLTTGANPVLVGFSGSCQANDATAQIAMGVQLDNTTNVLGTTGIVIQNINLSETVACAISVMTEDLTAASHTLDFQWNTSAGTATMSCGTQNPCNFWVVEVTD